LWSDFNAKGTRGLLGLEAEFLVHVTSPKGRPDALLEFNLKGNSKSASELMPRVHLAVALLKRWLMGTHQGGVSLEHLNAYLDEFTFRFNRRKPRSRGKLFYRLLEQAVAVEPVPYKSLVMCSGDQDF